MSRNFELLQRLEQEYRQPPAGADTSAQASARGAACPILPCEPASAGLAPGAREEIANLINRVFFLDASRRLRCVVFSECEANNRATRITAWTSEVLARQRSGSTICAIDGNLRAPALHKEFGLPDGGILTDALLEGSFQENAPQRVSENLWLLQFGIIDSRQNEGRPLDLQHLRRRLTPLREQFDYVLIGAANVSRYPESLMFAQLADGVVLVTEAEETRIETVEQSKRALAGVNANLLGAVLNCKPQRVPDAIHKMFRLK